jgi:hypothetical protein
MLRYLDGGLVVGWRGRGGGRGVILLCGGRWVLRARRGGALGGGRRRRRGGEVGVEVLLVRGARGGGAAGEGGERARPLPLQVPPQHLHGLFTAASAC